MANEYRVTARKWRPLRFSDVTSQEFITTTLKNSVVNKRVSHAYLFSGPRGVGKTTVARILAKAINCLDPGKDGEPCNECNSCVEINNENRNHPDVFEIDGASNRNIDDVRELKEKVKYGPIRSRYKIFIIDEVHMLTGPSFNALLKTLEEPPEYIVFIFATTAPEKVPLTILGRCQKFDFRRLTTDEIISRLKLITKEEKIKADEESLFFMAKKGDGSMRDAQGLLDIATAYCGNNITFDQLKSFFNIAESDIYFRITDCVKGKDGHGLLLYLDELLNSGYDLQTLLEGLQEHIRNLLVVKSTRSAELLTETESVKNKYLQYADKVSEIELINSLKLIIQTEYTFKYSSNQRILFEVLLMELIKFTDTKDISALAEELKDLKKNSEPVGTKTDMNVGLQNASDTSEVNANKEDHAKSNDIPASPDAGHSIEVHWEIIKEQIKNEKKWIYSLIKHFNLETDSSNQFFIKLDPEQFEMLSGYSDYLASKINTYFGKESKFEFFKSESPFTKKSPSEKAGEDKFDKICEILIHDYNGRYVD